MNIFENIRIPNSELEYIIGLSQSERVQYLFELYDTEQARKQTPNLNLKDFFNDLDEDEIIPDDLPSSEEFEVNGLYQVDVMIDDQNILIESHSLKAVRIIRNRFIENGFIIMRDKDTEKMFKKDKITKYLRVFRIIQQIDPLCWN
jgi:hypothetical protein